MSVKHVLLAAAAIAMASPVLAQSGPLAVNSLTGTFRNPNVNGVFPGYVNGVAQEWSARYGQFGAEFAQTSWVDSLTIHQYSADDRKPIKTCEVWANGVYLGDVTLADAYQQTVDFTAYDWYRPILANYMTLVVKSHYTDGHAGASDAGLVSYSFNGTATGAVEVNLNQSAVRTTNAVTYTGGWTPADTGPWGWDVVRNGSLFTTHRDASPDTGYVYCNHNVSDMSVTVWYDAPQSIGSIGLAVAGGEQYGDRDLPYYVTVIGSEDGQEAIIDLNGWLTQYNRYDLPEAFAAGTEFLTILYPNHSSDWGWGGDSNYCLIEFQAFAGKVVPIPEPLTMSLLVLGGLALWRRK